VRVPPFPKWFGLIDPHVHAIHHQVIHILNTILQQDLGVEIAGTRDQMVMHGDNQTLREHLPQILPDPQWLPQTSKTISGMSSCQHLQPLRNGRFLHNTVLKTLVPKGDVWACPQQEGGHVDAASTK